jgi:hypothetical protein
MLKRNVVSRQSLLELVDDLLRGFAARVVHTEREP